MDPAFHSFQHEGIVIKQYQYSTALARHAISEHDEVMADYAGDIHQVILEAQEAARPNVDLYRNLYRNQPQITPAIRQKLVDFAFKVLVRLKIIPFVFYQGIQIFDRYCLSRIVILTNAQLAITTSLWIASKLAGGNNHFVNFECGDYHGVRIINDLGHGSGSRFYGPTESYRNPRLSDLVKLCGSKCNYDAAMFGEMELHILTALEWNFAVTSICDYIIKSSEWQVTLCPSVDNSEQELLTFQVAAVIIDLINDTLQLSQSKPFYQHLAIPIPHQMLDYTTYYHIRRHLKRAVREASPLLLEQFQSRRPQLLYSILSLLRESLGCNSAAISRFRRKASCHRTSPITPTSTIPS
ncbi:cyclin-like protein [Metschnikowia bicuspidata]|uniref:Cyclin-like protein n=1 Tax=Metschnikowia bicuspidata TaxID=27322 RepID=A0A4P9ZHT0_9ASCO|nr:cyclin-like protein [Metschnikowia bicuspidata]